MILISTLFVAGYVAYFKPELLDAPIPVKSSSDAFPEYDDKHQLDLLKKIMKSEKLYLIQDLSLKEVANQLKLPVKYVSFLINHYHQMNFRNFINQLRVEEVIRKMENGELQQKTMLALALESGFNSKATFNSAFKKIRHSQEFKWYQV